MAEFLSLVAQFSEQRLDQGENGGDLTSLRGVDARVHAGHANTRCLR